MAKAVDALFPFPTAAVSRSTCWPCSCICPEDRDGMEAGLIRLVPVISTGCPRSRSHPHQVDSFGTVVPRWCRQPGNRMMKPRMTTAATHSPICQRRLSLSRFPASTSRRAMSVFKSAMSVRSRSIADRVSPVSLSAAVAYSACFVFMRSSGTAIRSDSSWFVGSAMCPCCR